MASPGFGQYYFGTPIRQNTPITLNVRERFVFEPVSPDEIRKSPFSINTPAVDFQSFRYARRLQSNYADERRRHVFGKVTIVSTTEIVSRKQISYSVATHPATSALYKSRVRESTW